MERLLEVRDLRVATEGREILHGVDFEVLRGETVVILGANGAGKSTALRGMMGDLPASGKVEFSGEDVSGLEMSERAKRGMFLSWQAPVEIPGVTTMEMLWTALEEVRGKGVKRGEVELKIAEGVRKLKMEAFWAGREVNVGASGGERKKGEILQMLVLEPKLVMLDEIDSGLDMNAAKVVSKVVAEYQAETGAGLVIVTHNQRILEELKVDKVLIMEQGNVIKFGDRELIEEVKQDGLKNISGTARRNGADGGSEKVEMRGRGRE